MTRKTRTPETRRQEPEDCHWQPGLSWESRSVRLAVGEPVTRLGDTRIIIMPGHGASVIVGGTVPVNTERRGRGGRGRAARLPGQRVAASARTRLEHVTDGLGPSDGSDRLRP
jgi:hypothetical protein